MKEVVPLLCNLLEGWVPVFPEARARVGARGPWLKSGVGVGDSRAATMRASTPLLRLIG